MVTLFTSLVVNVTSVPRTVWEGGREYLVADMVTMVPGVLEGSRGPLYYPPDHVAMNPGQWDHIPLTLQHPRIGSEFVSVNHPEYDSSTAVLGEVRNDRYDHSKGKRRAEGWFDVRKVENLAPDVLKRLRQGRPVELSTGLTSRNTPVANGSYHNGRKYTHVATHYKPDHLAVLPDRTGACSVADGCGILVNESLPRKYQILFGHQAPGRRAVGASTLSGLVANLFSGTSCGCVTANCSASGMCDACKAKQGLALNAMTCPECGADMQGGKCPKCGYEAEVIKPKGTVSPASMGGEVAAYNEQIVVNAMKASTKLRKDGMTPDKACKILDDGEVQGHALTDDQKGMFGALCGKRDEKKPTNNTLAAAVVNGFCATGKGGGTKNNCGKKSGGVGAAFGEHGAAGVGKSGAAKSSWTGPSKFGAKGAATKTKPAAGKGGHLTLTDKGKTSKIKVSAATLKAAKKLAAKLDEHRKAGDHARVEKVKEKIRRVIDRAQKRTEGGPTKNSPDVAAKREAFKAQAKGKEQGRNLRKAAATVKATEKLHTAYAQSKRKAESKDTPHGERQAHADRANKALKKLRKSLARTKGHLSKTVHNDVMVANEESKAQTQLAWDYLGHVVKQGIAAYRGHVLRQLGEDLDVYNVNPDQPRGAGGKWATAEDAALHAKTSERNRITETVAKMFGYHIDTPDKKALLDSKTPRAVMQIPKMEETPAERGDDSDDSETTGDSGSGETSNEIASNSFLRDTVLNVFCKLGKGGGVDPSCKRGGAPGPNVKPATKSFFKAKAKGFENAAARRESLMAKRKESTEARSQRKTEAAAKATKSKKSSKSKTATHGDAANLHEEAAKAHEDAAKFFGGGSTDKANRATNAARSATEKAAGKDSDEHKTSEKLGYLTYQTGQSKKTADNARGPQAAQSARASGERSHRAAAEMHRQLAEAHRKKHK